MKPWVENVIGCVIGLLFSGALACIALAVIHYQRKPALETISHDGHLFIIHSSGTMTHHPGCSCHNSAIECP